MLFEQRRKMSSFSDQFVSFIKADANEFTYPVALLKLEAQVDDDDDPDDDENDEELSV